MALVLADRVQETTTTSGTGSVTLAGAVAGFQSFAVVGNGNTCYYAIVNGSAWEVGIGTYSTTGPALARTTVLSNSSGNTSPITLSGGSNVFLTYPAEKSINYDADGVAVIGDSISYADTGVIATFASTVAGYNQMVLQNKSTATNASTNLNVSNNTATSSTGFAELGINSSTFSNGSGAFNIPGASYLASASTDLSIGTYGAYNIHFATNSSTTDSVTIFNTGGVSLGGNADPGLGALFANNLYLGFTEITAAAGTTVLTNASADFQHVVGTTTQTIQMPDATTLYKGLAFTVANSSTGAVTITNNASATLDVIVSGSIAILTLMDNATSAGTWVAYSYLPSSYNFSTSTANFGGAALTNGAWNGDTVATGYGGTGLTTFTGANNALYSTSASALAAGTLPVAAGGTGVTSSSGANSVMLRDANQNVAVNRLNQSNTSTASAAGTTVLTAASSYSQTLTGTLAQTYQMPDATTLTGGVAFIFNNNSSGLLTLQNSASATIGTITSGGAVELVLLDSSTAAGVWDVHGYLPENVTWGTNALALGGTVITGGTWNGGTVTSGYGGTGLTTFTAANNALYSTAAGTLTAGTLPVLAGGTGVTTPSIVAGASIGVTGTWPNQTIAAFVRVTVIADGTTVTINADTTDVATQANTQIAGTLTINAPTGTPANGQKFIFRLLSTNVQTFSWNAVFQGSTDTALPSVSTGTSKYDYFGFIWNSTNSKWQLLAKNMGY
jgi:hypothetical protein